MINLLTEKNHSGAKFDDNAYGGKSRGLNGTGSAATLLLKRIGLKFQVIEMMQNGIWNLPMVFQMGLNVKRNL